MVTITKEAMTAPVEIESPVIPGEAFADIAAVSSGIATEYWLELLAYPSGSARSLWLNVDGQWRHLDNPNVGTQDSVQEGFTYIDKFEIAAWYNSDVIVGLVVRSK